MVTMKVGDEDSRDDRRGDISEDKLALRAFSRIKKETLIIPAEKVATMVALSSWLLA